MKTNYRENKVTIKTISEILGVSPATISKALRNSTDISEEMKKKVRDLSEKLGYQPNLMARSLVNKKSGMLGVIIPDINISYYSFLVQYIYEQAQSKGYESIMMFHHEDHKKERKNIEFLLSLQVDGIFIDITNGNRNCDLLQQIHQTRIPILCFDRNPNCSELSLIAPDVDKETAELINAIVKNGKKRIGYVGVIKGDDVTVARFQSFKKHLKNSGLEFDPKRVVECKPDIDNAEERMRKALRNGNDADAFICAGGLFAFGAGKAVIQEGLKMPEDILLGEYGNNNIVKRLGVSYYSTDHSPEIIAKQSVDLMHYYLTDDNEVWEPQQIFVPSKLIYHDLNNHKEVFLKTI